MGWSYVPGKVIVFRTATALNIIAYVFYFVGFSSPYWVQSWPRIHSGFKKIGLWEACFAGLVLPFDPAEKAYYGCWWIFAPEYKDMRQFLMPWWFILTQLICTIVFTLMFINLILHIILWISTSRFDKSGVERRAPIQLVQAVTVITIFNAAAMIFTVILFGVAYYLDRNWMPYRRLNYLSWSYGLTIVSTFFSIFASFALIVYNRIVRQDYREPGTMRTPLAAPSPPSSYTSPTYAAPAPTYPTASYPGASPGYPGASPSYPGTHTSQSSYHGGSGQLYPGATHSQI